MKKTRDKKFGLARETIRELTSPEDKATREEAQELYDTQMADGDTATLTATAQV
jgi:hypothetical protein